MWIIYSSSLEEEDVEGACDCEAECCHILQDVPYRTKSFSESKKKQGKQSRTFQKSWLAEYNWLTYCTTRNTVFCFYCRKVNLQGGLTFSKRSDDAFTCRGFSNWKKAKEKFREHEKSHCHREACMKYEASKKPSVVAVASTALKREQQTRWLMLLKQLSSLRFLMRQGLPVRGHCKQEGNLEQLMKYRAEDIPNFQQWLESGKYLSPEIVNELIQLMALQILRTLLDSIRSERFYSLIVGETRDVSGKEQLAISLRWVNGSYEIFEELIGLVEVERTDAASLKSVIKDVLIRCNIPIGSCRGQAYDGAANMAGHLNGVAAQIQSEEPKHFCTLLGSFS